MPLPAPIAILGAAKVATVPDVSVGHLLGHTVVALLIIVGGIWAVQKIWTRQRGRTTMRAGRSGPALQIVSRHSLGKDQHLAIVRWGEREILVGISGSHITFFEDGTAGGSERQDLLAATGLSLEIPSEPPASAARPAFVASLGAMRTPQAAASTFRPVLERLRDLTERS